MSKPHFNRAKINKKFIRMVLHQTFPSGTSSGARELLAEAYCLRGIPLKEYEELIAYLVDSKLIQFSGADEHYYLTTLGEDVKDGSRGVPAGTGVE